MHHVWEVGTHEEQLLVVKVSTSTLNVVEATYLMENTQGLFSSCGMSPTSCTSCIVSTLWQ